MKFFQDACVYVCDFIEALLECVGDIYYRYRSENTTFQGTIFKVFNNICDLSNETFKLRWKLDLNSGEEHHVFKAHLSTRAGAHLNAIVFNAEKVYSAL